MINAATRSREFPFRTVEVPGAKVDPLLALVWECGTLGVEELPGDDHGGAVRLVAYFESDELRDACRRRVSSELPDVEVVDAGRARIGDWESLLHGGFEPVAVGPLLIVPAQPRPPSPGDSIPLLIDPGLGCGTGTHATTYLCLQFLVELIRPGAAVLDVGTGSGVLAIAAALLGASEVLAVDTDPEALGNAASNIALNSASEIVALRLGSIELAAGRRFDLVLANILAPTLLGMLDGGLTDLIADGGSLVLSGFAPGEAESLGAAAEAVGLRRGELRVSGDWAALRAERQ